VVAFEDSPSALPAHRREVCHVRRFRARSVPRVV